MAQILNERYRLEATLGEGGMARVYRGTDDVLGRPVAIKVLSDRYAGDEKFVARFRREAQAAAGVNHPNIVSVYDTGDDGTSHYIVMEFVEGETLGDLLKREGPLDPDRAARIAEDVTTALQAAHDRELVHRDVKPGNVMIDGRGRGKVVDFGIARAAADDTLTQTGTVLGTAAYLSPEQARGDGVDGRSDIYSLGCVLYEMLTGRPPFTGDSPVSLAFRHVNEEPRPPSAHNAAIPAELEAAVLRALEKDPDRRFPNAEAFRQALASARNAGVPTAPIAVAPGGDTEALPTGEATAPIGRPPAPPRRRPRIPAWMPLAAIVAAVLALAGILALSLGGREERRGGGQRGDQQEQPAPEEESPSPEIPAPGDALGAFEDLLVTSVSQGQVSLDAAERIADKVDAAADRYVGGDLDHALDELEKAHDEVERALGEGEIASEEVATALHQGIDVVAASMQAAPPEPADEGSEEDGDESSGPGNSDNAPGHDKDGDEGDD